MQHEFAIFIGRFSPFHLGHHSILKKGFEIANKIVIVLGSHNRASDIKNPWSTSERSDMIKASLSKEECNRVIFVSIKDYLYNDNLWITAMQNKIAEATSYSNDIVLIGFNSDASSYYLKLFPKWKFYSCPSDYDFHATQIRDYIFSKDSSFKKCVHESTALYLDNWIKTENFNRLKDEFDFVNEYRESWRGSPFPVSFMTVDTCVLKSGHILLVKRKGKLGKGLLALPGGFLEQDETTIEGALRELKEETSIKVSREDLKKSIIDSKILDSPTRSLRGRTVSFAYMIDLGSGELPGVKSGSDSSKSFWMPLNEIDQRENEFFEDHYFVIKNFISKF